MVELHDLWEALMRTRSLIIAGACAAGLLIPGAASAAHFPEVVALPTGFQPEGIAVGRGPTFYAGSLATGAVIRGDLRTGAYETLVASASGPAVGIAVDPWNRVWVAGGPSREIRAYDGTSGSMHGSFTTGAGFINDLAVTRDAVYATNSAAPSLAVVPLGQGGSLPAGSAAEVLPLTGFPAVPGFNANGIEAWPDGRLVVAHSAERALFAVDPATGQATRIDLGQSLPNVDGITRQGDLLYAVQNRLNQVAVVRLDPSLATGEVVDVLTNPAFDVPTTVALFGDAIYVVNARFGTPSPSTADFAVVRTPRG
jgi:sugar lactone lactonase YvrE